MKTVSIHARIKPELKNEVESILDKIGLTTTEAIKLYFNQIVLTKSIPLNLKLPNDETVKVIEEIEKGINLHKFDNAEEMFKELNL